MSKDFDLLKGANCVDVDETSNPTYNYYGFTRNDKSYTIMRVKTDGSEIRYKIGASTYATDWANRATLGYKRPDEYGQLA
jgi:hypothetical protein